MLGLEKLEGIERDVAAICSWLKNIRGVCVVGRPMASHSELVEQVYQSLRGEEGNKVTQLDVRLVLGKAQEIRDGWEEGDDVQYTLARRNNQ